VEWFSSADLDDSSKYSNRGIFLFALRTVVGKGSVSTVFVHGLVGPNLSANVGKPSFTASSGLGQGALVH